MPAGRGTSLVFGTVASTGFEAITWGEVRTDSSVGISEYCTDRTFWACVLAIHLMKVRSAAMFLLCGLMYRFQPPMLEYPG